MALTEYFHCIPVSNNALDYCISSIPPCSVVSVEDGGSTKLFEFLTPLWRCKHIYSNIVGFAPGSHLPRLSHCIMGDNNCILQQCTIYISEPDSLDCKIDNVANSAEPGFSYIIVLCPMLLLLRKSSNQRCIIGSIVSHDVSKLLCYSILSKNLHNLFRHIGTRMRTFKWAKSNDGVHANACFGCKVCNNPKDSNCLMWTSPAITGEMNLSYCLLHQFGHMRLQTSEMSENTLCDCGR